MQDFCINGVQIVYLFILKAVPRERQACFPRPGSMFGADTKYVWNRFRTCFALSAVKYFLFQAFFPSGIFV